MQRREQGLRIMPVPVLFINGRNCWSKHSLTNPDFDEAIALLTPEDRENVESMCNTDRLEVQTTLLLKAVADYAKPSLSPFAIAVKQRVETLLRDNPTDPVLLLGTSYGGYIVTRVAQAICKSSGAERLYVATFGTVHVPSEPPSCGAFVQYIIRNDAAIEMLPIRPPQRLRDSHSSHPPFVYDAQRSIVWMQPYSSATHKSYTEFPTLLRLKDRLEAHTMYRFIISQVLRRRSVHVWNTTTTPRMASRVSNHSSASRRTRHTIATVAAFGATAALAKMALPIVSAKRKSPARTGAARATTSASGIRIRT
jgi:hypothetical protein